MEEQEIRHLCRELIENAWPAYLTTVDSEGYPQTRAMFNLRNAEKFPSLDPFFKELKNEFTIIFSTNTSSTKMQEIKHSPLVSVYCCIPERSRGAMFGGSIEIVEDDAFKKSIWLDGWERYYPSGYNDPDYTVLRLEPDMTKGWAGSRKFRLKLR
jgi:general stress protein 26